MMKKLTVAMLVLCSLSLVGCNSKGGATAQELTVTKESVASSSSASEQSVSPSTSSSQEKEAETPWNQGKAEKLNQFMLNWGKTMDQTYKEYRPDQNVDLYGLQLPDDVLTNKEGWQGALNDSPIKLAWSEDGLGDNYALVSVFSDAETQPYLKKHVYFFTLVAGEAKVLVTMQNQGNEHNYLYFNETDNQELQKGFAAIVAGEDN